MKLLNGSELAGFIKERQARQVRGLRQSLGVKPKLAIVQTIHNPVIDTYVRLKKTYGADILVDVDAYVVNEKEAIELIPKLNADDSVHGIIIQLPLNDPSYTEEILEAIAPEKDVDGLGKGAVLDPATPLSIVWLLAGYNVELKGKKVTIVGQGRLVGAPLARMLTNSGIEVTVVDSKTENMDEILRNSDVIITATGAPHIIKSDLIKIGATVVDAGVATDSGKLVGDLAPDVYDRHDLTITPQKGGVGPLTVCALFENVIRAAQKTAKN